MGKAVMRIITKYGGTRSLEIKHVVVCLLIKAMLCHKCNQYVSIPATLRIVDVVTKYQLINQQIDSREIDLPTCLNMCFSSDDFFDTHLKIWLEVN